MKLRDYQTTAIQLLRDGIRQGHKRQILMLATGSGKTAISASIIKSAADKGKRVWFVVDNLELVDQSLETFRQFGLDVAVIQGDHEETDYSKSVQVITAQTLTRRWGIFFSNRHWLPDLVFVDECHSQYKAHHELAERVPNVPFIGLSASPFSKGLGKLFSNLIIPVSMQELIDKGHLVDFDAYGPDEPNMKGVKVVAGEYNNKEASKKMTRTITGNIVKTWIKQAFARKATIVFACNIAHSKSICDEFLANGIDAVHLDGYTDKDERKEIIARFKAGEIKVLCSVAVLVKGFDAPIADTAILAAPTKSLMRHIQCIGRVLRTAPGKKNALILDHAGNFSRLGYPTDQLPEYLDSGEKAEGSEQKEKEEKLPKPCPECSFLSTSHTCPQCGHAAPIKPNVEAKKGTLKKLKREAQAEKTRWFSELKGYARAKGYKDGWAFFKYQEKFGIQPTRTKLTHAVAPGEEVLNWITHRNIKNRHERRA